MTLYNKIEKDFNTLLESSQLNLDCHIREGRKDYENLFALFYNFERWKWFFDFITFEEWEELYGPIAIYRKCF